LKYFSAALALVLVGRSLGWVSPSSARPALRVAEDFLIRPIVELGGYEVRSPTLPLAQHCCANRSHRGGGATSGAVHRSAAAMPRSAGCCGAPQQCPSGPALVAGTGPRWLGYDQRSHVGAPHSAPSGLAPTPLPEYFRCRPNGGTSVGASNRRRTRATVFASARCGSRAGRKEQPCLAPNP
jgi:hypothetical protein